jgi:hypothetical protein
MPIRFEKVNDMLYRGGAPEDWEVKILKDVYGINKIISLDEESGNRIHNACKENEIEHIIIPIETGLEEGGKLIKKIGPTKIINNVPSYVHCYHGKDRTGLFVAKYRIENGWSFDDALKEALSFGFGVGMQPENVKNYIKLIANNKYTIKTGVLCESCGMLIYKDKCLTCKGIEANLKDKYANIVDNSREDPNTYQNIDEDTETREVSDMLNVPENITDVAIASYFRKNIIKYLMKKAVDNDRITFKVPNREKKKAKIILDEINSLSEKIIRSFIDHLDLMYEPFSQYKGITPEQASDASVHLDNFASVVEENLTKIKKKVYKVMKYLEDFDSDTSIYSMLNSLDDSTKNISTSVNNFVDVLSNKKESIDFQDNATKSIEIIKKETSQLKRLIDETISDYIKENILLEDWTTEIKEDIVEEEEEQETKED